MIAEGSVFSYLQEIFNIYLLHSENFIKICLDSWSDWFLSCLLSYKSLTWIACFSSILFLEFKGWALLKTIYLSPIIIHYRPDKSLSTGKFIESKWFSIIPMSDILICRVQSKILLMNKLFNFGFLENAVFLDLITACTPRHTPTWFINPQWKNSAFTGSKE